MARANYYISCKLLFEAEKKLRTLNLIKSHVDISHLDISYGHEDHSEMNCDLNFDDVGFEEIDNMDVVEQSTVYYVAGYVGRSISRRNKCRDCKSLLVESDENDAALLDDKHLILNDLNRGGLSLPSDFCYTVCLFSYLFYRQLEETNRRKSFLCSRNQRNTFLSNVLKKLPSILGIKIAFNKRCGSGHVLLNVIITCIFNCFAKNLKRHMNDEHAKHEDQKRKLLKFKSSV